MWRNSEKNYGHVARVLHWAIALLFISQIFLGLATQSSYVEPATQFSLYQWHKSFGFLVLLLALIRCAWFFMNIRPEALAGEGRLEKMAAHSVHRLLLALTIIIPLTGWALVSSSTLGIPSFVFDVFVMPNLPITPSDDGEAFWSWVHAILGWGAGALILLHASAALYHHFVRKDDTLRRMMGIKIGTGSAKKASK